MQREVVFKDDLVHGDVGPSIRIVIDETTVAGEDLLSPWLVPVRSLAVVCDPHEALAIVERTLPA
jgi:hypothetical protein